MKKALVVCDGDWPSLVLFEHHLTNTTLVVACDGAYGFFLAHGFQPSYIIGDLDTYHARGYKSGEVPLLFDPDQETNDLEKALNKLHSEGIEEVILLGLTGKRLDHTLKNISVLAQFSSLFKRIYAEDEFGCLFLAAPSCRFAVPPGTIISLFPLSGVVEGITTHGLKYPLSNEPIENGVRDGSSNEASLPEVHVSHTRGQLLVMVLLPRFKPPLQ